MKYLWKYVLLMSVFIGMTTQAYAVTVYFKDGRQLEVESVTRVGDSVCLFVDIADIDTTRTQIEELPGTQPDVLQEGLNLTGVDFSPSEDGNEIIASGNVVNNSAYPVQQVQVTVVLKDKQDAVLLTIRGYVKPERLEAGQTGQYRLQVKKPQNFWKASVDVQAEAVQQP